MVLYIAINLLCLGERWFQGLSWTPSEMRYFWDGCLLVDHRAGNSLLSFSQMATATSTCVPVVAGKNLWFTL